MISFPRPFNADLVAAICIIINHFLYVLQMANHTGETVILFWVMNMTMDMFMSVMF